MEQDIEELKRLLYKDRLTQYGKRKLIEYYEQRIKELEEENTELKECLEVTSKALDNVAYDQIPIAIADLMIPKALVEEKLEKEKLPNIIVGGRRNAKTLEYGKKLGRIEMCEELLERRK